MTKGIFSFISLAFMLAAAAAQIPDVLDFFTQVDDASRITWGHRINSRAELADAISDPNIMMLEADVIEGHLIGRENNSVLPIMGHPPETTSDLSLDDWIQQVIQANEQGNKKGAKIDFKDVDILEESLQFLQNYSSSLNFPVWLNADILVGPGGQDKTPVDQRTFLTLCKEYFPQATLSIGWTTGFSSEMDYMYTTGNIEQMATSLLIYHIRQPVTFPIRAALVKASVKNLIRLMDMVPNSSFTIWSAKTDVVDMTGVADLIYKAGRNRVYVDIPDEQMRALDAIFQEGGQGVPFGSSATRANQFWFSLSVLMFLSIYIVGY